MELVCIITFSICLLTLIVSYFIGRRDTPFLSKEEKKELSFSALLPSGIALSKIPVMKLLSVVAKDSVYQINGKKIKNTSLVYGKARQFDYMKIYSALSWIYFLLALCASSAISYAALKVHNKDAVKIFVFGCILSIVSIMLPLTKLQELAEKKQEKVSIEFTVFINKVLLLINAGMTVSTAWKIASADGRSRKHPLYQELNNIAAEIAGGVSEAAALESFAQRMGVKEITRCISTINLNLKKGGDDVVASLNGMVNEFFENKKTLAKRKGEKASTNMTFPMVLALVAVILAIGAPAYLSMSGSILG